MKYQVKCALCAICFMLVSCMVDIGLTTDYILQNNSKSAYFLKIHSIATSKYAYYYIYPESSVEIGSFWRFGYPPLPSDFFTELELYAVDDYGLPKYYISSIPVNDSLWKSEKYQYEKDTWKCTYVYPDEK